MARLDPAAGGSLLSVDDCPFTRLAIGVLLEPLGWKVTFAPDGKAALEAAAYIPFEAVLLDLELPVMDGLATARELRRRPGPNQSIPIVVLTGAPMKYPRQVWARAGVQTLLSKPIEPEVLIEALAAASRLSPEPRLSIAAC